MADPRTTESPPASQVSGQVILVLRNLLAERYPDLGAHVNTVSTLSEAVGREVGLADEEVDALRQAALLHDIGKLALPESILARPGPLDKDEWRVMSRHTVIGAGILITAGVRSRVVDFVRSSHERVDGRGYPDGLVGEQIPLGGRVIAVCDAYDAMTSPRPYRPVPMSGDGASMELMRSSGTQFDAGVVDALCQILLRHDQILQLAEVGVAELALDHVQRHALTRHLNSVRMAELVGSEPPSDAGLERDLEHVADYIAEDSPGYAAALCGGFAITRAHWMSWPSAAHGARDLTALWETESRTGAGDG